MNFCVVIPTLNRPDVLAETLDSIGKQSILPERVIVIDQSDDRRTEEICAKYKFVKYVHSTEKSGAKSRNIGIGIAEEDVIFFLDDDVELLDNYFRNIMVTYEENDNVIAIQGWVVNQIKFGSFSNFIRKLFLFEHMSEKMRLLPNFIGTNLKDKPKKNTEIFWCNGCGFSVKTEYAKKEMFENNFVLYSLAEDRDFSFRLSKHGKILVNPNSEMIHKVTSINRLPNEIKILMTYVHQMYLVSKNFGWSAKNAFAYWWNIFGRLLITTSGVLKMNARGFATAGYNWRSFIYVLKFGKSIRNLDISDFNSMIYK